MGTLLAARSDGDPFLGSPEDKTGFLKDFKNDLILLVDSLTEKQQFEPRSRRKTTLSRRGEVSS